MLTSNWWIQAIVIGLIVAIFLGWFMWVNYHACRQSLIVETLHLLKNATWCWGDLFDALREDVLDISETEYCYLLSDLVCAGLITQWQDQEAIYDLWHGERVAPNRYALTERGRELLESYSTKEGKKMFKSIPFTR